VETVVPILSGDLELKKLLLDLAFDHKLSHLGSYFSTIDIVDKIYSSIRSAKSDDIFILSSGHAAAALYCVIEKYHGIPARMLFEKHGGHPHYDSEDKIHCSTGSLGMGITVAVGRALANPSRTVHCLISDGECAEGSIWEALRLIHDQDIKNIKVYVNINGYAAYDSVDRNYLKQRLLSFLPTINIFYTDVQHFSFLRGINAHYHVMDKSDYILACQELMKRASNEKTI